jgi:hypothetical protein
VSLVAFFFAGILVSSTNKLTATINPATFFVEKVSLTHILFGATLQSDIGLQ